MLEFPFSGEDCFDSLEEAIRFRIRGFIEAPVEEEVALWWANAVSAERSAQRVSQRSPGSLACRQLRRGERLAATTLLRDAQTTAHLARPLSLRKQNLRVPQDPDDLFRCVSLPAYSDLHRQSSE